MLISLTTLLTTLCSLFRSRVALELENLALRHQIGVLQRSARKRPRLTPVDRNSGATSQGTRAVPGNPKQLLAEARGFSLPPRRCAWEEPVGFHA